MIRPVFKLIWNRKRTNFLMMTEIFVAFLVLFAVVALGVYTADNWWRPIGYSIDRVWSVTIAPFSGPLGGSTGRDRAFPDHRSPTPQTPRG